MIRVSTPAGVDRRAIPLRKERTMPLKIALSSSYWSNEAVQKALGECDMIYTSNIGARDKLYELFGKDRVKFMPNCATSMLELVRSWYPGETFIEYSDLRRLAFPEEYRSR